MKRFYKEVTVLENDGHFQVTLDGRPVKTALGKLQTVPTSQLAEALASEWSKQGGKIDTTLLRMRDLADFAIDMVAPDRDGTIAKLLGFLETDTLCYRADPDEPFYARQQEIWEPLLSAVEQREGISLHRISGIMHRPQPEASMKAISERLDQFDDFQMTALLTMTSLAASLTIGMAAMQDDADAQRLWSAANLEEDWQIEQWGQDYEAADVRERRTADFLNAWEFERLARG